MSVSEGERSASVGMLNEARDIVSLDGATTSLSRGRRTAQYIHRLHYGRFSRVLVEIVSDAATGLHRIAWPDIGLGPPANLARC